MSRFIQTKTAAIVSLSAAVLVLGAVAVLAIANPLAAQTNTATSLTFKASVSSPFSYSDNCNNRVSANGTCTATVEFNPTTSGLQSQTLRLDFGNGVTRQVRLSGNGTRHREQQEQPKPTLDFTAAPSTIESGSSASLVWEAQNANSCTASGSWSGTKSVSGTEQTAALTSNATYSLACTGLGGTVSTSTTVTVVAPSAGDVLRVGPNRQFKKPSEAAVVVQDGNTVEIDGGTYSCDTGVVWGADDITVRGVGGKPHIKADGCGTLTDRVIWDFTGSGVVVENIELSGANAPGLLFEGGGLVVVRSSYVHDNKNEIEFKPKSGVPLESAHLVVEGTELEGAPATGRSNPVHVQRRIGSVTVQNSYIHDTDGRMINSLARENYVLYNRLMDGDTGESIHQMDFDAGGLVYIIGNLFHQAVKPPNFGMISYAHQTWKATKNNPNKRVYLVNNTIVNDRSNPKFLTIYDSSVEEVTMLNNLVMGVPEADFLRYPNGSPPPSVTTIEGNVFANRSAVVNANNYDYHLSANSPAIDAGVTPGSGFGRSLTPDKQYLHPLRTEPRPVSGNLDAGAFEFGGQVSAGGGVGIIASVIAAVLNIGENDGNQITISEDSLNFGDVAVGSGKALQFVISYTTRVDQTDDTGGLTVTGVRTEGDFAQTNDCSSALVGGESCAIRVTFVPSAAGTRTGTLTITHNGVGSPERVRLSGIGAKEEALPEREPPEEELPKRELPEDARDADFVVDDIFSLESAIANAKSGDTIAIRGGDYNIIGDPSYWSGTMTRGGFYIRDKSLNFIGIDGTPVFHFTKQDGTSATVLKGLFTIQSGKGNHVLIDNLKFKGARNGDRNGAGIRLESGDMTVRNSIFEDNQDGIFGIELDHAKGRVVIENTVFDGNGWFDGRAHDIYISSKELIVENSVFKNTDIGHHVKSLSEKTVVRNSTLDDGTKDNAASRAFDITGGGDVLIEGNTVVKGQGADNPQFFYYTAARKGGEPGEIIIRNNEFNAEAYTARDPVLAVNTGDTVLQLLDNTIRGVPEENLVSGLSHQEGNTLNGVPLETKPFDYNARHLGPADNLMVFDSTIWSRKQTSKPIHGDGGNDRLVGSDGQDTFFGGKGDDILIGKKGSDFFYAGDGNDIIVGDSEGDILVGNAGDDQVFGGEGGEKIYGGTGNDILLGGNGRDTIVGSDGDDILIAGDGNKGRMNGGAGNDTLIGGPWTDQMHGGANNDIFYGAGGRDTYTGADGTDTAVFNLNFSEVVLSKAKAWRGPLAYGVKPVNPDNPPEELTKWGEITVDIEFLQFDDGVFNTQAGTFSSGEVRVRLGDILSINPQPPTLNLPPNTNSATGESLSARSFAPLAIAMGVLSGYYDAFAALVFSALASATGFVEEVIVSPTSLNFGEQEVGTASAARVVTVTRSASSPKEVDAPPQDTGVAAEGDGDTAAGGGSSGGSSSGGGSSGGGRTAVDSGSTRKTDARGSAAQDTFESAAAGTVPQPAFSTTLSVGVSASSVRRLQALLNRDPATRVATAGPGSPGQETANYGSLTEDAVRRFQCKHNVVCSGTPATTGFGLVGPRTRAALNRVAAAGGALAAAPQDISAQSSPLSLAAPSSGGSFSAALDLGSSHVQVQLLQRYLAADPSLYPEALVTGYFGSLTQRAVQRFQCTYNIVCSGTPQATGYGRVGPVTRAALNAVYGAVPVPAITPTPAVQRAAPVPQPVGVPQDSGATPAPSGVLFGRTLAVGDRGEDVQRLQRMLSQDDDVYPQGYITGVYTVTTGVAVRRFQCKHRIVCSGTPETTGYGLVGPQTQRKLQELYSHIE